MLYTAISCNFLTLLSDFLITPARASPSASFCDSGISLVSAVRVIYGLHDVKFLASMLIEGREGTRSKYLQSSLRYSLLTHLRPRLQVQYLLSNLILTFGLNHGLDLWQILFMKSALQPDEDE